MIYKVQKPSYQDLQRLPKRRKQFKRNRRHTVCAVAAYGDSCRDNRLMTIKGSSPYFRKYSSDLAAHLAVFTINRGHCQPAE
jgi:hypothetical protein